MSSVEPASAPEVFLTMRHAAANVSRKMDEVSWAWFEMERRIDAAITLSNGQGDHDDIGNELKSLKTAHTALAKLMQDVADEVSHSTTNPRWFDY